MNDRLPLARCVDNLPLRQALDLCSWASVEPTVRGIVKTDSASPEQRSFSADLIADSLRALNGNEKHLE